MGLSDNIEKDKRVGLTLYICYLALLIASVAIVIKIIYIQLSFNPDPKIAEPLAPRNTMTVLEPLRGNILDCEGRLLALSFPEYEIRMDCTVGKSGEWEPKAEQLAKELPSIFPEKSAEQYLHTLKEGRRTGQRYLKIGRKIDYGTLMKVKKLPLLREGRNKGGLIIEQRVIRKYPYGRLAGRTIGFVRDNRPGVTNNKVGLEGKYNDILHGVDGHEWKRVSDKGRAIHNFDSTSVKARDGKDLRTTINIDFQEAADRILRENIEQEEAVESATLALMEVKTGALRAVVNLSRENGHGQFAEITNTLIGRKHEPGSVFKTVTLLAALSEGTVDSLDMTIPTNHGFVKNTKLRQDSHITDYERETKSDKVSILWGMEHSSNYVLATLAVNTFGKDPNRYLDYIHDFMLDDVFEFDLDGLQKPTIPKKKKKRKDWNLTDLGSMGFGYTTEETPLHILTFYNAIANDGRMMKPYLLEAIEDNGKVEKEIGPQVLNAGICSKAVADSATRALVSVTKNGTAKWSFRGAKFDVAGKTGTSFGTYKKSEAGVSMYHDKEGRQKYQGTFVCFFPADDPKYSAICAIYTHPTRKQYQGGGIPARTLKYLSDYLYNIDPHFRTKISK